MPIVTGFVGVVDGADAAERPRLREPGVSRRDRAQVPEIEYEPGRGGPLQVALEGALDGLVEFVLGQSPVLPATPGNGGEAAPGVAEAHDHHVVTEGQPHEMALGPLLRGDVVVVGPENHPAVRPDPVADPGDVFRHGLVAILFACLIEMVLNGDAQALESDLEGVHTRSGLIQRPPPEQQVAHLLQ